MTYGERFHDLKDLCRRYQIYGWTSVPRDQIERDPGACSFLFPVLPQGLNLAVNTSNQVNQIWNRAREGHIPLIASLYRFYRGSIRIRIVVTNGEGLIMWVQHRPDRRLDRNVITPCTQVSTAEAVFNHSYGMYMQDMSVNHVVEIEVPYYQMANFGLLQKPVVVEGGPLRDWSHFYSLGELSVGFFGVTPANDVRCTIYYSIADDCRFSTYQGIPPMVIIDDLPEFQSPDPLKYQGLKTFFGLSPKEIGAEVAEGASEQIVDDIHAKVMPMLEEYLQTFTNKLSDTYSSVKECLLESTFYSKLTSIASQIIHAINNPTPRTIAISVISILIILGIITYSVYEVVHKYVISIWEWVSNLVHSKKVRVEVENGQEATEALQYQNEADNAAVGFLSLLCGGMCTLFGIKNTIKYKPMSDSLFTGISNGMKMSNVCFVFFKNLMSVIGDMKSVIVSYAYPGFNAAESLMNGRDIIEKWINYSQEILDPMFSRNLMYDHNLQKRLLDCYAFGKILKVKALDTNYPAIIQLINTTFDKLHKKHVELVAQGLDPHVRKMPFTIYNYGEPEIGKSHLTTDICVELCKSQDITTETELMCVLNATSKFWDNCDRQPCLVMDDAFNVKKGTMLEDQIASIFNIVSPVVLVPPKAAVEDKGRMYNPEIFILNSNVKYFKTELCEEKALWRRRDILIETVLDTEFVKEGCVHCEKKLKVNGMLPAEAVASLKDYHHLKFKYTFDVTNVNAVFQPENRWLKYPELLDKLKELFKQNRESENMKFAHRVEQSNIVAGNRVAFTSSVDNLEELWNDAIERRRQHDELVRNSTFKSICQHFSNSLKEKWEDNKHHVLSKIYNAIKPGNNKYFNKNNMCRECNRLRYQCISCRMAIERLIEQHEPTPSTSSSQSISFLSDDKCPIDIPDVTVYQGPVIEEVDDPQPSTSTAPPRVIVKPVFHHDIGFLLNSSALGEFSKLKNVYPDRILDDFKEFLVLNNSDLSLELRKYPVYARSFSVFKSVCQSMCKCNHNVNTNKPIKHLGEYAFIDPQNPTRPSIISQLSCTPRTCWMMLPWKVCETARHCASMDGECIESWMEDLVSIKIKTSISLNDIFARMTKYVYDFYYNIMKPAVKVVFSWFSTFEGWVYGISFISLLCSTIVMSVGTYEVCAGGEHRDEILVNQVAAKGGHLSKPSSNSPAIAFQSPSYDGGKARVSRVAKPKVKVPVRVTKDLEYQSSQQFTIVEERIKNNMASIIVDCCDAEGKIKRYHNFGLMLRDQQMLIQKHYYDFWKRLDITAKFYFKSSVLKEPLLIVNFFDLDVDWFYSPNQEHFDSNFGILHLPKIVPAFKDLTKFIAKSTEHEYIKSDECYLFSSLTNRSLHCVMNLEFNKTVTDSNGWLRLDQCYSYRYTGEGLCGSVLMCSNLERPIIGIHFAGTSMFGYSEPICAESFKDFEVKHYDYVLPDFRLAGDEPRVEFDTLLYPQGTIENTYSHHQGSVSQYIPSKIHGVYEVDTEPNPLSPSDPRLPPNNAPLKKGVEHMGKPPIDFEKKLLSAAADDLKKCDLNTCKTYQSAHR